VIGRYTGGVTVPIYKVDIEKFYEGEYWTNRYLVDAVDLATAVLRGDALFLKEKGFHLNGVGFTKLRVSDSASNTDVYVTIPLNDFGVGGPMDNPMPLFNCLRVDFPTGVGRPSRKYYRGVLTEASVSFNSLLSTAIAFYNSALQDITDDGLVDPQGQPFTGFIVWPRVQMRQLRRGKRRRTTAIL
jgi:hypothetical protein